MNKVSLVEGLYSVLKEVPDLEHLLYIQRVDVVWYRCPVEVIYNIDNSLEDLKNGNGRTFGLELKSDFVDLGDYWAVNLDGCMGYEETYFLRKCMEVGYE